MGNSSSPTKDLARRFFLQYYWKIRNDVLATSSTQPLVRSYLFMRKGVGTIGVALPFVLIVGKILLKSPGISDSISAYYYSVMRDVFVGGLCTIGLFLICYRYDHLDDFVSTLAGLCAIGVAFFPVAPDVGATQQQTVIGLAHASFATCFFLILAFMVIFLFRRTVPTQKPTGRKHQRNTLYLICGSVIIACVVLAALTLFIPYLHDASWLQLLHPILWLESGSILAFGVAWFVKGETLGLLKDDERGRNEQKS